MQEWTDAYRRESRPGSDTQSALTAAEAFLLPASGVTNADDGDAPAPAEGSDAPAADAAAAGVQALPEWLPPTLQEAATAAVASGRREAAEKLDAATQQLQAAEAEAFTGLRSIAVGHHYQVEGAEILVLCGDLPSLRASLCGDHG